MWLIMVAVAMAVSVSDVPNPRPQDSWVADMADVLADDTELLINQRIDAVESELGVEIAVVTVPTVGSTTPKQFTTALFNHWGIGKAAASNGLLMTIAVQERRLEMETGDGLADVLPDGWLGQMQAAHMVPFFKKSDYDSAVLTGLDESLAKLREQPLQARLGVAFADMLPKVAPWPEKKTYRRGALVGLPADEVWTWAGGMSLGIFLLGLFVVVRRRNRVCGTCAVFMPQLDEVEDDAHLTDGQRTEEEIGSVNYHVHMCPYCDTTRVFRRIQTFFTHSRCPSCRNRTKTSSRTVISSATYTSSGSARVNEQCAHCSFSNSYTVTIPKKERPTTNSSSSGGGSSWSSGGGSSGGSSRGSSFGGGRSGGGGAGSSW